MQRDHIAVICPAMGGVGSVADVALRQAAGLAASFDTTLISDSHRGPPIAGVDRVTIAPAAFGWLHRFGHAPREVAFALAARTALIRLHRQRPLSFILCHGHVASALAAAPLRRRHGIACGLVTHGDIYGRPSGTYDTRLTWLYRRYTPVAYRAVDLVVALSPHMRTLALNGGAAEAAIRVIPNGIDPASLGLSDEYLPPVGLEAGVLQLLYVGRLSVEKGVDILLDACNLLSRHGIAFRLSLVGDGPLRGALQAQARQLEIGHCVSFGGIRPRLTLGALYRSAHVVCVPSRSDPLPTVVLEAMAAGRTVVGSDAGGIPYMVVDGVTGLVVPAENPTAFACAIEQLALAPQSLIAMGEAGQARSAAKFGWPAVTRDLANAIAETISGRQDSANHPADFGGTVP